jgi:hypothetical protein
MTIVNPLDLDALHLESGNHPEHDGMCRDAARDAARAAARAAAWAALRPTVEEVQANAVDLLERMCAVGRDVA